MVPKVRTVTKTGTSTHTTHGSRRYGVAGPRSKQTHTINFTYETD